MPNTINALNREHGWSWWCNDDGMPERFREDICSMGSYSLGCVATGTRWTVPLVVN